MFSQSRIFRFSQGRTSRLHSLPPGHCFCWRCARGQWNCRRYRFLCPHGGKALNEGFLGTAAPRSADVVLLLEFGMAVALLIGAVLARMRRFRLHAWCQSAIGLLNLVVIVLVMVPSFHLHVSPKIPLKLGKAYYALATAHRVLGSVTESPDCTSCCGHERFATQIPSDRTQTMDARFARALVAGAPVGICNIRPLVCPGLVSEMNSWSLFSRLSPTAAYVFSRVPEPEEDSCSSR
jgi:hypothetical protein